MRKIANQRRVATLSICLLLTSNLNAFANDLETLSHRDQLQEVYRSLQIMDSISIEDSYLMETALSRVDYEAPETQEITEILYRSVHIAPESLNLESNLRQILRNNQRKTALLLKRQNLILQAQPLLNRKDHWIFKTLIIKAVLFWTLLYHPHSPYFVNDPSTRVKLAQLLPAIFTATASTRAIQLVAMHWKSMKMKTFNRMDQQLEFEIDQLEGEVSEKVKALQEKTKIPFFREITEELGKKLQPDMSEESSPPQIL